ncbi:SGNH/GDSL hydrolase family protein [Arthrobacter agilis]|uniref:SGNH/GDSL hydrolase family protein n=1 Tax=Arthrobacter agilis TaxID=37921 RepID=UPI000B35267E|nr:SGNH/GDSL hydrolase family protein [Arthrobacter agilis]OUM40445.1 lipase [Arthrobacter agilis]PPB45060.1 SGNH/GDSL hydrolase family protein [Arthrobacter agilis]TPV27764.1 SGNH/GDSL hydrolase family protein [Arthrobacter agilis]VDR31589.1 GDSL-like Lipase/Acylhydrolase [Arthrobacter agilis]
MTLPAGRYVALGDSFTEGVGDPHKHLPNGVRGWADRVADTLAKDRSGWEYANLAIRSKRLRQIAAEQLEPALAMKPTLVTLYAGGNDVLDARTNITEVLRQYEEMVAALSSTGATLLLFTGYDIEVTPALRVFRRRNHVYNEGVRGIAARYDAVLVDYWRFEAYRDARLWAPDRLHMSKAGHKYLASRVLGILGVEHSMKLLDRQPPPPRSLLQWERAQRRWVNDWIVPLVHRKIRGVTLGDDLQPRWPVPVAVPPRGGLRRLAKSGYSSDEGAGPTT